VHCLVRLEVDQQLRRRLALKLAHPERFPRGENTNHQKKKARLLAGLIELHLVPFCVRNPSDEGISNGSMPSGRVRTAN
jgi:hypothetical protein